MVAGENGMVLGTTEYAWAGITGIREEALNIDV